MRSPDVSSINFSWRGNGASPGTALGTAVVIQTENDFLTNGNDGDIIVARHATPAIFPLLLRARGAVCETGGLLCHLAVLAREIGKPCVTGLAGILDVVKTGDLIRIDGASGTVSLKTSDGRTQPPPKTSPEKNPPQYVPVMQFGIFSPTFEFAQPHFSLHVAVSIAALISLPTKLSDGASMDYLITEREVLLSKTSLNAMIDALCDQLEAGTLEFSELTSSYQELSGAKCWADLQKEFPSFDSFKAGLKTYFRMSQITWAAASVRDALVSRYWTFLSNVLVNVELSKCRELFLNTLITPGCSYIVSCLLHEQVRSHKWSEALRSFPGLQDFQVEAGRIMAGDARQQRKGAIDELRQVLAPNDFDRAQLYINALTELVAITERKNTDLHRCEELLFCDADRTSQSAASIGLSLTESPSNQLSRKTIVASVLALLEAKGSVHYLNGTFLRRSSARA